MKVFASEEFTIFQLVVKASLWLDTGSSDYVYVDSLTTKLLEIAWAKQYYNSIFNPHLIKLTDANQWSTWLTTRLWTDIELCDDSAGNQAKFGKDANGVGYCANKDPPGFFAILYYNGGKFKIKHNIAHDYDTDTKFFIYTTDGTVMDICRW